MSSPAHSLRSSSLTMAACAALTVLAPPTALGQITGAGSAPSYSAASIVNAATQTVEALAPNALATVYGSGLAFSTRAVATNDIVKNALPTNLDGVAVWVNAFAASLLFVSPTQINFLVPYALSPQTVSVIVVRDTVAGPVASVILNNTSPGLFLWGGNNAIATHLSGLLVSTQSPAHAGEIIVTYAGGLGRTAPDIAGGQLATAAFSLYYASQLQILFNGHPCPPGCVLYAGLAPGFAGLYQINLKLPADIGVNPEIRIVIGAQSSPPSVILAVQ